MESWPLQELILEAVFYLLPDLGSGRSANGRESHEEFQVVINRPDADGFLVHPPKVVLRCVIRFEAYRRGGWLRFDIKRTFDL